MRYAALLMAIVMIGGCASTDSGAKKQDTSAKSADPSALSLGNFSVSLAVKDLVASRAFYEKLGFHSVGGDGKRYVILQNDTSTIGLFQGFITKNTLTYNPGWDRNTMLLPRFEDVRDLQKKLKERGITPTVAADEASDGTAFFIIEDPDGNPILVDQHVPRQAK